MRKTISITLPDDLKQELDRATAEEGASRSDLIRKSLRDYLWVRQFRAQRRRLMAKAQAKGLFADQDVFDNIS